jgi:malic enzyme
MIPAYAIVKKAASLVNHKAGRLAGLIVSAMVQEGLSLNDAQARISMFDVSGLLEPSRKDLFDFQQPYAHSHPPSRDFIACIESLRPTAILGVSTVGKTFTRSVIEAMSRLNDRPIIFALSNPTEHAECTPEEAYQCRRGRRSTRLACNFRRFPMADGHSCLARPTTSTSSPRSAWPSTPPRRSA